MKVAGQHSRVPDHLHKLFNVSAIELLVVDCPKQHRERRHARHEIRLHGWPQQRAYTQALSRVARSPDV